MQLSSGGRSRANAGGPVSRRLRRARTGEKVLVRSFSRVSGPSSWEADGRWRPRKVEWARVPTRVVPVHAYTLMRRMKNSEAEGGLCAGGGRGGGLRRATSYRENCGGERERGVKHLSRSLSVSLQGLGGRWAASGSGEAIVS